MTNKPFASLSIILPVYNEKACLDDLLKKCLALNDLTHHLELVFIDDGSSDGSKEWIQKTVSLQPDSCAIYHEHNLGIGPSIHDGYEKATGDWIVFLPTDLQFDPDDLKLAIPFLTKADIISYYRKTRPDYTRYRLFVSNINRHLNKILFGLRLKDVNWVKLYRNWVVKNIPVKSRTPFLESERVIRACHQGARLVEIESPYYLRRFGTGKGARFKTVVRSLTDLFKNTDLIFKNNSGGRP